MSYVYEHERPQLFTDEGCRIFVAFRDRVLSAVRSTGAIRMQEALRLYPTGGDTWTMIAHVDRMVEIGDLREITGGGSMGQHRVFVPVERSA